MAARNIAIRLSIEDAEKVRAGLMAIGADGKSALAALETGAARSAPAMRQVETAANDTGRGMQRFGQVMGQAGYQVQDFAVQVSSGQSALVALSQQGSQMLGVFGTGGAIAGAVLTVGVLATQLLGMADAGKAAKEALDQHDALYKTITASAAAYRAGMDEEAKLLLTLRERYVGLSAEQLAYEQRRIAATRSRLVEDQTNLASEARGTLGSLPQALTNARQLAERANMLRTARGQPTEDVSPQLREVTAAILALNASTEDGAAAILRFGSAMSDARALGGPLSDEIGQVIERVDGLIPRAQTLDQKLRENAQAAEAAGVPISGVGTAMERTGGAAEKAAAQANALARSMLTLRQIALENPTGALDQTIAQTEARIAALERNGLRGYERLRDAQTDNNTAIERGNQARQQFIRVLEQSGLSSDAAEAAAVRLGTRFQDQAQRSVELERRETGLREAITERGKAATRASSEAERAYQRELEAIQRVQAEIYNSPKMTSSGLLALTAGDERAIAEIERLARAQGRLPEQIQKANEQASREAERSYEKQAREAERTYDRIADYAGDRIADLFTDTEGGWEKTMANVRKTAIATFARIAAEALLRPIVMPVVQSFMGGGGVAATAAGIAGNPTMSAMAQRGLPVTDANATVTGFNQRSATDVAGSLFDTGNSIYSPGYSFSSGYAGKFDKLFETNVGGWLDRPAFGGVEAFGPNTGANPTAPLAGGVTYGQAIAGGASIVGGAYGIWQGAQTGGAKGWAQGIGGAAGVVGGAAGLASAAGFGGAALAGVATVAPYVALIAAVVAQFLPAAKPSNREGNSTIDLGDGSTTIGGATGGKYSDENRAAARGLTDAIKGYTERLTTSYGLTATGRYTVGVGDRDGMYLSVNGGRQRDYKADEEGTKNLLREVSKQVIESAAWQFSGPMATTYATVGTGDIDRLLGALDWTKGTYQAFLDNADPAKPTAFAQSLKQVSDAYDPLIAKAREYGLAIEPITAVMDEQLEAAERARNMQFEGALQDMGVAASQLRGGDLTAVTLSSFDRQRTTDWLALMEQVKQMGLGEADQAKATASFDALRDLQRVQVQRSASRAYEDSQASLAGLRSSSEARFLRLQGRDAEADALDYAAQRRVEETALRRQLEDFGVSAQEAAAQLQIFAWETAKGAEAVQQAARDNAAGQAAGVLSSLRDYARSLQTSDAAPGTVLDRLAAAQSQYERTYAAALGGDAQAISGYREAAETWRGLARETYGGGQGYVDAFRVISEGMGRIAEMGSDAVTQSFIRQNDRENTLLIVDELRELKREVANLRRDNALLMATPR